MELANKKNTIILIPVYNSELYLEELISRAVSIFPKEHILLINDGSTDKSKKIIERHFNNYLNNSHNCGKGKALKKGFKEAIKRGYLYAITLDSDLQYEPEEIPFFMQKQNNCFADIVIGKRHFSFGEISLLRIIRNHLTSKLVSSYFKQEIPDSQSGYRLYNLKMVRNINILSNGYQFDTEILLKLLKKNAELHFVPIKAIYRGKKSFISYIIDFMGFISIYVKECLVK